MTSLDGELNNQELLMEKALKRHLGQKDLPDFSDYLFHKIITGINRQQRAQALKNLKIRLWTTMAFLTTTLVLFAVALDSSVKAFAQTPSYNFISLMFTDFGAVMSNWQDFSYSILEALPLGAMVFLLGAFLASAVLGEYAIFQWKNFRRSLTSN